METILLGTEGNQPFPITQSGVSRRHAQITIDDNGQWTLKDLNSKNGTFIRNENGDLKGISSITITPMTFICLGPNNVNGCSFYACHTKFVANYIKEFDYLKEKEEQFEEGIKEIEKKVKMEKWILVLFNIVILLLTLLPFVPSNVAWTLRLGVPILSTGFGAIYDGAGKKKKLESKYKKFFICPNPKCSHTLRSAEIKVMQCNKCKCK